MKKLSISQMEKIEGGLFWGWGDKHCTTSSSCWKTCHEDYFVFWIKVDYRPTYADWDYGCLGSPQIPQ